MKATPTPAILNLLAQEGCGLELIRRAETPEDYFAALIWDP